MFIRRYFYLLFLIWISINDLQAQLTWSQPVNISFSGENSLSPQVWLTPEWYANVIWSRYDDDEFVIQTSVASFGLQHWFPPDRLSYIGQNAFYPDGATDQYWNSTAVWSRFNGINYVIQSSFKQSHQDWSAPVVLSGKGPQNGDAIKPQIAIEPHGFHMVIWQKDNGINNVIQCCQKNSQGVWSKPVNLTIANPIGLGDIEPQIAIDNSGNATAVWINDSTSTVRGAVKPFNQNWSAPFDISDNGQSIGSFDLALDAHGNATVVWSRSDGVNYIIQAASQINGQWSVPINLSQSGESAIQPSIAIGSTGNKAVIWNRFDGANTIVQAAIQLAGGNWFNPIDLSEAGQDASDPQINIDEAENLVAIWKRSDGQNFIIQSSTGNIFSQAWSTPVSLSEPGQDATNPVMALSITGNAVVAWLRSDGANSIVQTVFGIKE